MLHLALAANMLVSIGGRPQMAYAAPTYPGQLPLQVHPELTVHLVRAEARHAGDVPRDRAARTIRAITRPQRRAATSTSSTAGWSAPAIPPT